MVKTNFTGKCCMITDTVAGDNHFVHKCTADTRLDLRFYVDS